MRILLATSELHPYSKTGGLADMVGALAKFLARAGHKVAVVTPLYRGIQEKFPEIKWFDWSINLPMGSKWVQAEIWTHEISENLTIYFVRKPEYYFRSGLYEERNISFPDNAERFIFLSKCAVNLARYLPLQPEVVHVHDWQVALMPLMIQHQRDHEDWLTPPRTCLTIHNLAYQGVFAKQDYDLTNLPATYFHPNGVEFFGNMNCLKAGIEYSDLITTVSPR
ncbi:MAG: glycogen synthase, partial [Limisphaerales bacterium]